MGSPLPPDPYLSLGVAKDATTAAIKAAHRKLVLKCHPDKVSNPEAKQAAADEFHKIQTAYEILVDEDRRARYNAQVKLAELRKEALERQAANGSRSGADRPNSSSYRSTQESAPRGSYNVRASERPAPHVEERKPSFAPDFDPPPRATTRKEAEYERSSRRPAPSTRDRLRAAAREAKEREHQLHKEKARRAEQEARRSRDRKYNTAYAEDDSESDSDDYAQRSRSWREEEEQRKARDAYHEKASKQRQEASSGYFDDARTRKMFAASADAWDYIRSSGTRQRQTSERRPSPVRQGSSKDKFDIVRGKDGRPSVVVRKPSERPSTTVREPETSRRPAPREPERRSSAEKVQESYRPPTFGPSKSSPAEIHIPADKPRAQSLQEDKDVMPDIPQVKRAETMPYGGSSRRTENADPRKSRPTEFTEGLATPAPSPDFATPAPLNPTKYDYGKQYADDEEYPTPNGYLTELRQPPQDSARPKFTHKVTRSTSPPKDLRESREPQESRERERPRRTASTRYPSSAQPPPLPRTTSKSYVYKPSQPGKYVEEYDRQRPSNGRDTTADPRYQQQLYGEIRQPSASPRQKYSGFDTPEETFRYQRQSRPEDILRAQSGYYRTSSNDRPNISRGGSENPVYMAARA